MNVSKEQLTLNTDLHFTQVEFSLKQEAYDP